MCVPVGATSNAQALSPKELQLASLRSLVSIYRSVYILSFSPPEGTTVHSLSEGGSSPSLIV